MSVAASLQPIRSAPTRSKSQSPPPRIECSSSVETDTCGIASVEDTGRRVQKASCGGVEACRCVSEKVSKVGGDGSIYERERGQC